MRTRRWTRPTAASRSSTWKPRPPRSDLAMIRPPLGGRMANFVWRILFGMADMRARSLGLAFAAILLLGRTVPGHAENAASKPAATPAAAQTPAQTGAQTGAPASVPRPTIAP